MGETNQIVQHCHVRIACVHEGKGWNHSLAVRLHFFFRKCKEGTLKLQGHLFALRIKVLGNNFFFPPPLRCMQTTFRAPLGGEEGRTEIPRTSPAQEAQVSN